MRGIGIVGWLLALLALSGQAAPDRYEVGQVWAYRTRPGEEGSLLKIRATETAPDGRAIYHISVIGLHCGGETVSFLPHLPVSRETLDLSVTDPATTSETFPDPAEGIQYWRGAKGGVFTIGVAEIVAIVNAQLSRAKAPAD